MDKIQYYAAAMKDGQICQLLVTRENGTHKNQEWTGKVYGSAEECEADLAALNRPLSLRKKVLS